MRAGLGGILLVVVFLAVASVLVTQSRISSSLLSDKIPVRENVSEASERGKGGAGFTYMRGGVVNEVKEGINDENLLLGGGAATLNEPLKSALSAPSSLQTSTSARAQSGFDHLPPAPNAVPHQPRKPAATHPTGLIFIKTYKTASTTVAMILNSIAFSLRLTCLHPLDKGWFTKDEIGDRADSGQTFDMSFRHMSPVVEFDNLSRIVPDAFLTTIVRNPVTKFNSMFNFVKSTRRKYGTAENFVDAVFQGKAEVNEMNDLCNNLAYSLSGKQLSLARYSKIESEEYAAKMIADLEARNMFGMVMEMLPESLVVVCEKMNWDCYSGAIKFKDAKERRNTDPSSVKCQSQACVEKIKTCNYIDWALHDHYVAKLGNVISSIPDFDAKLEKVKGVMKSSPNSGKYPVNCRKTINPQQKSFDEIHHCEGNLKRPHW